MLFIQKGPLWLNQPQDNILIKRIWMRKFLWGRVVPLKDKKEMTVLDQPREDFKGFCFGVSPLTMSEVDPDRTKTQPPWSKAGDEIHLSSPLNEAEIRLGEKTSNI